MVVLEGLEPYTRSAIYMIALFIIIIIIISSLGGKD